MIQITHLRGVGVSSVYQIVIDGETRGRIATRNDGRKWNVFDAYGAVVAQGLDTKDKTVAAIKSGVINIPTLEEAYENKRQNIYNWRKEQAIKHLAPKMYEALAEIDKVSETGGDLPPTAHDLVTLIERAALGETDLEFSYGTSTFKSRAVIGAFPTPPKKTTEAA